jgi:hypothetical protein
LETGIPRCSTSTPSSATGRPSETGSPLRYNVSVSALLISHVAHHVAPTWCAS